MVSFQMPLLLALYFYVISKHPIMSTYCFSLRKQANMLAQTYKDGSPKMETHLENKYKCLYQSLRGPIWSGLSAFTLPLPYSPVRWPCFSYLLRLFPIAVCSLLIGPICLECWYPHSSHNLTPAYFSAHSGLRLKGSPCSLKKTSHPISTFYIFFIAFIFIDIFLVPAFVYFFLFPIRV